MNSTPSGGRTPLHTDHFHIRVYKMMLGMLVLFVLAAWYGFGDSGYVDYLLIIVTGFMVMAATLPLIATRVWRHHPPPERMPRPADREEFFDWSEREIDVDSGKMTGGKAAFEALLPLGAVSFAMLIFAILTHIMR
ncbi:hypothetical protein [Aliihoeflea sp. PC F10.4]